MASKIREIAKIAEVNSRMCIHIKLNLTICEALAVFEHSNSNICSEFALKLLICKRALRQLITHKFFSKYF